MCLAPVCAVGLVPESSSPRCALHTSAPSSFSKWSCPRTGRRLSNFSGVWQHSHPPYGGGDLRQLSSSRPQQLASRSWVLETAPHVLAWEDQSRWQGTEDLVAVAVEPAV